MNKILILAILSVTLGGFIPAFAYADVTPSPVPPGYGALTQLFGRHPNVKNNSEIMDFIDMYGLGNWYEKRVNESYRYVYLLPKKPYSKKLVYLNKDVDERQINNSIQWVRLIDRDKELTVEKPDMLRDFFVEHPEAKNKKEIVDFIQAYNPKRWDDAQVNGACTQVYLISEDHIFRELIFLEKNHTIEWIKIFEESQFVINRTKALNIAKKRLNASAELDDIRIVLRGSKPTWMLTYRDRYEAITFLIDVDNGNCYSLTAEGTNSVPGFSCVSAVISILFLLIIRNRRKKMRSGSMVGVNRSFFLVLHFYLNLSISFAKNRTFSVVLYKGFERYE